MPEVFRYSVDKLGQIVDRALKLKIPMVAIFPQTNSGLKNSYGSEALNENNFCLLYTSPSPRDRTRSRMPSSA